MVCTGGVVVWCLQWWCGGCNGGVVVAMVVWWCAMVVWWCGGCNGGVVLAMEALSVRFNGNTREEVIFCMKY